MKVYVVAEQTWDSYRIAGIYTTLEGAELARKLDNLDVDEIELDGGLEALLQGLRPFEVYVRKGNGAVTGVELNAYRLDKIPSVDTYAVLCFRLWARTIKDARRLAKERWAEWRKSK